MFFVFLEKIKSAYRLLRLHSIFGAILLFWPCAFANALFFEKISDLQLLLPLLIGSVVMRGAGCVVNDLWDQNIDGLVERTKNRPLVSGQLTNIDAFVILAVFLILGFLILLQFSIGAIYAGIGALPLVLVYPSMKRITYWPQIFLGITFSYGLIIVSFHMYGGMTVISWLSYIGSIFWVIGYDTIYAFMDYKDDIRVGIKSSSVFLLGKNYKFWIGLFYGIFFFLISVVSMALDVSFVSIMLLCIIGSMLAWQVTTLDIDQEKNCFNRFKSNIVIGAFVFLLLLVSKMGYLDYADQVLF